MKKIGVFAALIVMLAVGIACAQDAEDSVFADPQPETSPGLVPETTVSSASDGRYYSSRDRGHYDKSKRATHFSRAEFEANERTRRLAAMRWYGMSNSRPVVSPTPWYGTYSPTWTSGGVDPFRWQDPALTPNNYYYNGTYYGRPLAPQYYLLGY